MKAKNWFHQIQYFELASWSIFNEVISRGKLPPDAIHNELRTQMRTFDGIQSCLFLGLMVDYIARISNPQGKEIVYRSYGEHTMEKELFFAFSLGRCLWNLQECKTVYFLKSETAGRRF